MYSDSSRPNLNVWARATLVVTLAFFARTLWLAAKTPVSYGDDTIVVFSSAGRYLLHTFPSHFLTGLFSSFRGEDHTWPMINLYGFITEALYSDSATSLLIWTKVAYILYTLGICLLAWRFWRSPEKTLLLLVLFTFNLSLIWRNLISFAGGFAAYLAIPVWGVTWPGKSGPDHVL